MAHKVMADSFGNETTDHGKRSAPNIFFVKPEHAAEDHRSPTMQKHDESFTRKALRVIRGLWATRQTEKDLRKNKDLYVKTTLRELILYLIYIAILCIIGFGMTSTKTYYFTTVLRTVFTERRVHGEDDPPSFDDMATSDDFWKVLKGPILDGLARTNFLDEDYAQKDKKGYILSENKILGKVRLRQLRVTNHSCTVHEKFRPTIHQCYAPYKKSREDRVHPGNVKHKAWQYRTAKELGSLSSSGSLGRYGGGGFIEDLDSDYEKALEQIKYLEENRWLDRGTRVVFTDFTIYNANINLFCQVKLTVEFPASGGVVASKSFSTVKLIRYVSTMDYFVLACEILFVIFTAYYTVEEIIEIKRLKASYFRSLWNTLDVLILLISYLCIAFNIYRQVKVDAILDNLLRNQETFADFEFLSYWQLQFNHVVAFTVFLAWIKIFKYVSFNTTMTQLSTTLSRCAKDIFGFSIMFMIVFLAYAQLGYLLFGTLLADYRTFGTSVFTLFRFVLGDFDFHSILKAHPTLGPIFFLTYVFFVFFVLLNMFLAIINDTYSQVKNDMMTQKSEFELAEYFKKTYDKMLNRWNIKRNRIVDIRNALKTADLNKDGVIEFDEWRRDLKMRGYTDAEIENVFSRYDTDGDRMLRDGEQQRFQKDLLAEESILDDNAKALSQAYADPRLMSGKMMESMPGMLMPFNSEELELMGKRINRMEYSVGNVIVRIDNVLTRLEGLEKIKMKRRQAFTKSLGVICDDKQMTPEAKQTVLEKIIREELERLDADAPNTAANFVAQEAKRYGSHPFSAYESHDEDHAPKKN